MDEKLNEQEIRRLINTLGKIRFLSSVSMENIDKIVSRFIKKKIQ